MKILITESQHYELIEKLLENKNIEYQISYRFDNSINSISATVYLYKNNNVLGYNHGYDFKYDYDSRFNKLTFSAMYPNIENIDFFRFLPPDLVVRYFSDKVKTYLKKFIDNGYSSLPVKR